MPGCSDMKLGQVYVCKDCSLEIKVVKQCEECGSEEEGTCGPCSFTCCGHPMKLKGK
jgi:hypothetical protein